MFIIFGVLAYCFGYLGPYLGVMAVLGLTCGLAWCVLYYPCLLIVNWQDRRARRHNMGAT